MTARSLLARCTSVSHAATIRATQVSTKVESAKFFGDFRLYVFMVNTLFLVFFPKCINKAVLELNLNMTKLDYHACYHVVFLFKKIVCFIFNAGSRKQYARDLRCRQMNLVFRALLQNLKSYMGPNPEITCAKGGGNKLQSVKDFQPHIFQ